MLSYPPGANPDRLQSRLQNLTGCHFVANQTANQCYVHVEFASDSVLLQQWRFWNFALEFVVLHYKFVVRAFQYIVEAQA